MSTQTAEVTTARFGRLERRGVLLGLGAALVHDRRRGTVTAIVPLSGTGFVLDDDAVQEHKVTSWGRVLGSLCKQPSVVRLQLMVRTVPGGASATARRPSSLSRSAFREAAGAG